MVGKGQIGVTERMREEPWGEQYFPGLTEYEAGEITTIPKGPLETVASKVRKYPWKCMGVAVGVGAILGVAVGFTPSAVQSQD